MDYKGIIIEESLQNTSVLSQIKILRKRKVQVTPRHKTPWLTLWTLDSVIVPENDMENIAKKLQESIDDTHADSWYIDFKNDKFHYIIFSHKLFKVTIANPVLYDEAEEYGKFLGIPSYQMGFKKLRRKL